MAKGRLGSTSIGDGGMGFAISPENFRRVADMRRAINGLCRPAALACNQIVDLGVPRSRPIRANIRLASWN